MLKKFEPGRSNSSNEPDDEDVVLAALRRMPRTGVVLFDQSRESGWACLAEEEPFRFWSPVDLPNDCLWITDAPLKEFNERWKGVHHLRHDDYMGKLRAIAEDIGIRADGNGRYDAMARQVSRKLAPVVHRTMVMAGQLYGWRNPTQHFRNDSLTEDLRRTLIDRAAPPMPKTSMRTALAAAYQSYSAANKTPWAHSTITLRVNRLEHAQRIMATRIPDLSWTYSDEGISLKEALDPECPSLVQATVEFHGRDPEIASLCAFGSQVGSRSVLRTWIAQPELRWLSEHAHVQITASFRAAGHYALPRQVALPELLTSDPIYVLSLSAGLLAQCHWRALAADVFKPSVEGKKEVSAWAVWLRATDRAYCFDLALRAHRAGLSVFGYGNGAITLNFPCTEDGPKQTLPRILEFAMDNDITHPTFLPIFREYGLAAAEAVEDEYA